MSILVVLAVSCKKTKSNNGPVFKASIETDVPTGERTYLYDYVKVGWSTTDQIVILSSPTDHATYTFSGLIDSNPQKATFHCPSGEGVQESDTYWSFYPASRFTGLSGDVFSFSMPKVQHYVAGTFENNLNPMAAKATDGNIMLPFKNAFGVLQIFPKQGNVAVDSITITDYNNVLWGDFTVDRSSMTVSAVAGQSNHTLSLDLGGYINLEDEPSFYFILPPGALSGAFTIDFYDDGKVLKSFNLNPTGATMGANILRKINVNMHCEALGIMVSDTEIVEFAPGNLQYQASTNSWRFAEHTWDFVDGREVKWGSNNAWCLTYYETLGNTEGVTPNNAPFDGTMYGANQSTLISTSTYFPYGFRGESSGWIDLFGWGTSGLHDPLDIYHQVSPISYKNNWWGSHNYDPDYGPRNGQLTVANQWDWAANPIMGQNGDEGWRTLTKGEWDYLINNKKKFGYACLENKQYTEVNGITKYLSGAVLLPIGFIDPKCGGGAGGNQPFHYAGQISTEGHFSDNVYTTSTWEIMSDAGAVFLPTAGSRGGYGVADASSYMHGGIVGQYWTADSNPSDQSQAYVFRFENAGSIWPSTAGCRTEGSGRSAGSSVRLARHLRYTTDPVTP